jgi:anion-transporting  ArsA/GET3 family ATPase
VTSALEKRLLVITGKGGVGKTTIAAAIGLLSSRAGVRTLVAELGQQARLPALFGARAPQPGSESHLAPALWSISIDPDQALLEWLQSLGGRVPGRVLAKSGTFQYFAAAAPGAKELVSMVKIWELTQHRRARARRSYELVVLDAPATGHALGMLESPRTFGAIARVGPVATQTTRVRELLEDPARTSYLAVAQPTEMAITETLELADRLASGFGRDLHAVVVNGVLAQRFSAAELEQLERASENGALARAAALAASAAHARAQFQRKQLARLRRRRLRVVTVPFLFASELALAGVEDVAERLRDRL